ncbi:hypothetical protein VOLCADRAFT_90716 [Volvox carteri f. nagariensis]|uniref:Anticodon-binding domain-containing protein n=1 Tax=Volvox carteri f. nagariensis TaxID=3068 RepID=D8TVJ2_VOLCA|nr:uncharacterized protein VOLCADRAFT_90716 [Volvox carteri f. nagariensis]EFJ48589.1 hypothetical protein VOLCADRAFT_90716 [Volvox carteri f. nagariensis]|eukprot:XP_002950388.1 hypothetical protein VOLCADRAFT_90716 [Volvox carteri f. nagariensis]
MNAKWSKHKKIGDASAGVQVLAENQPSATQPAPPTTTEAEGAAGAVPARKKQRRHKRGTEHQQQQPLDPEEAARRQRQRELRALAMKLRTEGKDYVPPRKGSQPRVSESGKRRQQLEGSGKGGEDRKGRHYLGDKTPGWRPFSSVEVIVLPIFWNNNKEEKTAVLAASERARDILASAGLSADMDASNKYTPGQKMKYWETMGVRVRVELGPRDVANGNCVVALSTKAPGEVATKNVVNMRHKMLDAVRAALEKAKSTVQQQGEEKEKKIKDDEEEVTAGSDGEDDEQQHHQQQTQLKRGRAERRKGDGGAGRNPAAATAANGDEEGAGVRPRENEEEDGEEEEEDVVAAAVAAVKSRQGGVLQRTSNAEARKLKQQRAGEQGAGRMKGSIDGEEEGAVAATTPTPTAADRAAKQPAASAPAPGADKVPYSADALDDDFANIAEFEAEEDKLTLSKKERLKKAAKQAKAKRKAERRAGMGGSEDGAEEGPAGEEREVPSWGKQGAVQPAAGPGSKKHKVVTF